MHRFLIAFVCLSALAMVQNVVVVTPLAVDSPLEIGAASEHSGHHLMPTADILEEDNRPEPATVMLLVAGLSGLTAVGGRKHDREKRASG